MAAAMAPVLAESITAASVAGSAEIVAATPGAPSSIVASIRKPASPFSPVDITGEIFPGGEPKIIFPVVDDAVTVLQDADIFSSTDFRKVAEAARKEAFAITADLEEGTVAKIRDVLADNLAAGGDRDAFVAKVEEILTVEGSPLSPAHTHQVFRNNVNAALSNGAERALAKPLVADAFPYRVYFATHDSRVREEHRAMETLGLDGTDVYHKDDPTWLNYRPPWDYNCRCSWVAISVNQAAERGVKEAIEWQDRARGMAEEKGGRFSQYLGETEPATHQFVKSPPFPPSPEFKRDFSTVA